MVLWGISFPRMRAIFRRISGVHQDVDHCGSFLRNTEHFAIFKEYSQFFSASRFAQKVWLYYQDQGSRILILKAAIGVLPASDSWNQYVSLTFFHLSSSCWMKNLLAKIINRLLVERLWIYAKNSHVIFELANLALHYDYTEIFSDKKRL